LPKDAIKAALFDPEPVFQSLNHLPMGMRFFEVHVERMRIGGADPFKSPFPAPEIHVALEVRVGDQLYVTGGEYKGEVRVERE
jgi:hypothetical protein